MDDNQERNHLAQADRHIAQAKNYIARQQLIIDRLVDTGQPTDDAWLTLTAFEGTLWAFQRHRATILKFLGVREDDKDITRGLDSEPPRA